MSNPCPNSVTNEDGERVCECGDEGRLCESCAADEAAYWSHALRGEALAELDPDAFEQAMRDAGRGHLVRP